MSFCSAKIPILPFFRGKSKSSTPPPPPPPPPTTKSFIEPRIYDLAVKKINVQKDVFYIKIIFLGCVMGTPVG
jgi:hypothetical protein